MARVLLASLLATAVFFGDALRKHRGSQPPPKPTPKPPPPTPAPAPVSTEAPTPAPETTPSAPTPPGTNTPFYHMECSGDPVLTTVSMTQSDYDAVATSVTAVYDSLPETCVAAGCPRGEWAACALRMAGHDFMDFADGLGGADGCVNFDDADNNGLADCLYKGSEFGKTIQDAYAQHCSDVSLADFLVITAEVLMEKLSPDDVSFDFKGRFRFGRTTAQSCDFAHGRLPNPERSCAAVEDTFVTNMQLSWDEAAALMGVHTLGRAKPENSGYDGWWSDPVNSGIFNNDYFVSLVAKGWVAEQVSSEPPKHQWRRTDLGTPNDPDAKEMMLNTDLCLLFNENAAERNCCAWVVFPEIQNAVLDYNDQEYCGGQPGGGIDRERDLCCGPGADPGNDCPAPVRPDGRAAAAVLSYANDQDTWVSAFRTAWARATENGQTGLQSLQ